MTLPPPFLTGDEIAQITEPLKQGAARIRYFEKLGCKVAPRPNGQPLVARSEWEDAMRGRRQITNVSSDAASAVNWQALEDRQKRPRLSVVS